MILLVRRGSKPRAVPESHGDSSPRGSEFAVTCWHRPSEKSDPFREREVGMLAVWWLVDGELWMTSGVPCRDGGEGDGLKSVRQDKFRPTVPCGCGLPILIFLRHSLVDFVASSLSYPCIPPTAGCFLHTFPFEIISALGKEAPGWDGEIFLVSLKSYSLPKCHYDFR